MPRSLKQIIDQADQLATRFEVHDPDPSEIKDAEEDVADATDDAARDRLRLKLAQYRALEAALGH